MNFFDYAYLTECTSRKFDMIYIKKGWIIVSRYGIQMKINV